MHHRLDRERRWLANYSDTTDPWLGSESLTPNQLTEVSIH